MSSDRAPVRTDAGIEIDCAADREPRKPAPVENATEKSVRVASPPPSKNPSSTSSALYTVVVEERPAGFRFSGDIIQVVNKYGALHQKLLADSRVVKVNDIDVDHDTFENVYISTPVPLTLTLEPPAYGVEASHGQGAEEATVTTNLLINFLLHYFSVFIDFFGILVTGPVLPFLMPLMDFTESELGLLVSIYNAASIPGALFCGWLTARCGTRVVMLYSLLGSALTLGAQGALIQVCLASSNPQDRMYFHSLLGIRVVAGLTGSSMPITMTFIGMKCPPHKKPKYMAMASLCLTAAVMVGPMVGGTLANFTPRFALPFYAGAVAALVGFLVAVVKLDTAKVPSRKGKKQEPMSTPLLSMISISIFIQLIYGAYIVMGVAYYMWRFGLKPEEVGTVLSFHGVVQSCNNVFVVPVLMKRIGQYRTYMLGCVFFLVGTAIVGFMDTWWAFQLFWSPLVGMGFSCVRTGTAVLCDRFSTMSNKPRVNAIIFTCDQIGLFASGIIYGTVLAYAKKKGEGYYFWLPVCGLSLVFSLCYLLVWQCVLAPHSRRKKDEEEKVKLAAHQHVVDYAPEDNPTDAEYMEYGKYFVDLLQKRNWYWRTKSFYIKRLAENVFVELPTDTLDHRMAMVWEIEEGIRRGRDNHKQIDDFYGELSQMQANQRTALCGS